MSFDRSKKTGFELIKSASWYNGNEKQKCQGSLRKWIFGSVVQWLYVFSLMAWTGTHIFFHFFRKYSFSSAFQAPGRTILLQGMPVTKLWLKRVITMLQHASTIQGTHYIRSMFTRTRRSCDIPSLACIINRPTRRHCWLHHLISSMNGEPEPRPTSEFPL